ncbi:MAG: cell division protein FtsX [Gammaproteobacteria bacterium]|nr:cell division protein FtsX [Gammaproteobacteria bacterium]
MRRHSTQRQNHGEPRPQGASRGATRSGIRGYFTLHLSMAIQSLGRLSRSPFATLMTAAVIGIALAMPTGLHVMMDNLQKSGGDWRQSTQISLFLRAGINEDRALKLAQRLEQKADIQSVYYISPEQALAEFQSHSGFGEVLENLQTNPLPAVLVVNPRLHGSEAEALIERLKAYPEVDIAQLDMQWLQRLFAIMEIVERGVLLLALLLGIAVLLIVGNTIRLAIENRRDEIIITKLIGATNAFIRRPFLYSGIWYGLLGGLIALLLVNSAIYLLQDPVAHLTGLYGGGFQLQLLSSDISLMLLGSGVLLGLSGSWLAVGRHLRHIEPR